MVRASVIGCVWIVVGGLVGACVPTGTVEPTPDVGTDAVVARSAAPRDEPVPDERPAEPTPSVPGDLDLSALMERTRVAFHPVRDARVFHALGDAHEAVVAPDGVTSLVCMPWDRDASTPWRVGPARLAGTASALAPRVQRSAEDGSLWLDHGTFREHLVGRAEGIEQSFHFDRPPSDAITIRLPVSGMRHVASDDGGVHFAEDATDLGFVYGHGTWIDAAGRETSVPASLANGVIELHVPPRIVAATQWPAVLDPVMGPELTVGVRALAAPTADGYDVRVTSAPAGGAVLWRDERASHPSYRSSGIWAAPLSGSTGSIPGGIGVEVVRGVNGAYGAASGAGTTIVVWTGSRDLRAATLSPTGVLGPVRTIAADPASSIGGVHVAFDGTRFIVTWSDGAADARDVWIAGLDATGATTVAPFAIVTSPGSDDQQRVACGASGCALVYVEQAAGVRAIRLDASLRSREATPIAIDLTAGASAAPAIAAASDGWMLAWDPPSASFRGLAVARLGASGTIASSGTISGASIASISLTNIDARVLATWRDDDAIGIRVQEIGADSRGVGSPVTVSAGGTTGLSQPSIGWNGTRILVGWTQGSSPRHVRLARLSSTMSLLDPLGGVAVTATGAAHTFVRAAWGGSSWLIVWGERAGGDGNVYGARLRGDGSFVDSVGFTIADTTEDERDAQVASTGTGVGWMVAYRGGSAVRMKIVSATGFAGSSTLLDSSSSTVYVGATADQYLVAWGFSSWRWVRFTPDGTRVDSTTRTSEIFDSLSSAAIVRDGTSFVLVWNHRAGGVRSARVTSTLSPSTGSEIAAVTPSRGIDAESGGGTFLAAWTNTPSSSQVEASRFTPGGGAVGARYVHRQGRTIQTPRIAFDGTDFVTFFDREPDGGGTEWVEMFRTRPDGTALDPDGVRVHSGSGVSVQDAVAGDFRRILLLYIGYDAIAGARRTVGRILDMASTGTAPLGTACTSAFMCASGHCIDGVCCDSSCGGDGSLCASCAASRGARADGTCTPMSAGTSCRTSRGVCDPAEACDGVAPACPADVRSPAGTVCSASTGPCELDATCTGTSSSCPARTFVPSGTVCRETAGACDVEEACDGASAACPADVLVVRGSECRASLGECDLAESCDGSSAACPADARRSAETTCRVSSGPCDPVERCDGTGATCPADRREPAGTVCGAAEGDCAAPSECDGRSAQCNAVAAAAGTECRAATDVCDLPEQCDGFHRSCPEDTAFPDGLRCDTDALYCNGIMRCSAGRCAPTAAPSCGPPELCSEETRACVAPPEEPPPPSGCACTVAGRTGLPPRMSLLLALVLLPLAQRRRRAADAPRRPTGTDDRDRNLTS
ncbi:MAG: hypothetical protein J0L92_27070 [Deltaproteobacteria bacterium]|nr:hypothetical protein [Deltaproteobacteria bacterium]